MSKINWTRAEFEASYGTSSQLPHSPRPEIVFSGRSNVGKSSLINRLCNRKNMARTSNVPGKTGTINFYNIDNLYLVDLPGYGYAKISQAEKQRWDELINGYFAQERRIPLLVQLIDSRHQPSEGDYTMLEFLSHHDIPFVIALTKADKLKSKEQTAMLEAFQNDLEEFGHQGIFMTSAVKDVGIGELKKHIEKAVRDN